MKTTSQKTASRASKSAPKPPPGDEGRDYVAVAVAYAEDACADVKRERYGVWIRYAARRFLDDLKRAQSTRGSPPFLWSPNRANHACEFIEQLHHVEGTWETETIVLAPPQAFFICNLFGFRNRDGSRRFTTALYSTARKNAKSTIAAAIQLYCLVEEREQGPQVISAATTGDQARIVWRVAHRMVEKNSELREFYDVEAFANTITSWKNGGIYRAINAKASTQDGLNPSCLCFDELHAHKTHDLYNVLRSAVGARTNPLFLYTTTEGFEGTGPWADVRAFAQHVLRGTVEADHFLVIYYALDEEDDDFDETKWIKANPLLGISVKLDKLREYALEAKQQPGSFAEFRVKRLNRRAAAAKAWLDLTRWNKCAGKVDLDALVGVPCWAAFDLASTADMTAWRLLWLKDGVFYTWGRYWVPRDAVVNRTQRGTVRYEPWVAAGLLRETEGNVADYTIIEADILADCKRFAPKRVGYDRWNASQTAINLGKHGVVLEQFIQGPRSYSPAMQACEVAYRSERLRHGGDPILTWNMSNVVARHDVNLNSAPDRMRSAEKIDGAAALFMAFGLMASEPVAEEPKQFRLLALGR